MGAYNEPLWVPALVGVPLRWAGVAPLATINVLILIGLVATALATYALARHWTNDPWGGVLAAVVFTFSTDFMVRLGHVQAMHSYALPLALLALSRLTTPGGVKPAATALLALSVIVAAFTSGYLAVMTVFALGGAFVFRVPALEHSHSIAVGRHVVVAAVLTLAVLLYAMQPWRELSREAIIDAPAIATALSSYGYSGSTVHRLINPAPVGVPPFFPGAVAVGLAGAGVFACRRRRDGARLFFLGIAVVGGVLSLGNLTPIYAIAAEVVPPLSAVRAPLRFGQLVTLAVAVFAGIGLSAVRHRLHHGALRIGVSIAVLALVTVEGLHVPHRMHERPAISGIYDVLAQTAPGPLLELPIFPPPGAGFPPEAGRIDLNARYLLPQTEHWRPLVNGFGAFWPVDFHVMVRDIQSFPDVEAVDYLRALGVRSVIDHRESAPRLDRETLAWRGLIVQAEVGQSVLYRIMH